MTCRAVSALSAIAFFLLGAAAQAQMVAQPPMLMAASPPPMVVTAPPPSARTRRWIHPIPVRGWRADTGTRDRSAARRLCGAADACAARLRQRAIGRSDVGAVLAGIPAGPAIPAHRKSAITARKSPAPSSSIRRTIFFIWCRQAALRCATASVSVGRASPGQAFTKSRPRRNGRTGSPPKEMLERQPDLPHFMAGGPNNPLGARALYLGSTLYRIHGSTNRGP